jgi:hypothetical protein
VQIVEYANIQWTHPLDRHQTTGAGEFRDPQVVLF